MMNTSEARGLIAVDKMGGKVIFLDPISYATTLVLDDFERVPHELLAIPQSSTAYVPIYGDGIHERNPNPGHLLSVIDLEKRARRRHRSFPLCRAARLADRSRRLALHHLREQRRGCARRSR